MDKEKPIEVKCEECQDEFEFNNLEVIEKSNINYHYLIGNNMPTECTESYWKSN